MTNYEENFDSSNSNGNDTIFAQDIKLSFNKKTDFPNGHFHFYG